MDAGTPPPTPSEKTHRWPLPAGLLLALPAEDVERWRFSMHIMEPSILPIRTSWMHSARYDDLLDYVERRLFAGESQLLSPTTYVDADAVFFRLGWVAFELFCNREHCGVERVSVNLVRSVRRRLQHRDDALIVAAIDIGLYVGFLSAVHRDDAATMLKYPCIRRKKDKSGKPVEMPRERYSKLRTLVVRASSDRFPKEGEAALLDEAVSVAIEESRETELIELVSGCENGETVASLKTSGFIVDRTAKTRTRKGR